MTQHILYDNNTSLRLYVNRQENTGVRLSEMLQRIVAYITHFLYLTSETLSMKNCINCHIRYEALEVLDELL